MILGIGNDVVYIPRIEKIYQKYGNKFLKKILTVKEIKILVLKSEKQICNHIAKRFAAKEALAKANINDLVKKLDTDIYTLTDIIKELLNPGLDPREELDGQILKSDI